MANRRPRVPLRSLATASWAFALAALAGAATPAAATSDGSWAQFAPLARSAHAMVADPARDRLVSFGGWDGLGPANDAWVMPLAGAASWTPFPAGGAPPPARSRHTMVLDVARDRLIVFGGTGATASGDDTWALALGDAPAWTELATDGPTPGDRAGHCAIYDPVRDRMIVFGGVLSDATVWSLSLSGVPAWTPLATTGPAPTTRENCTAVYDPVGDRMLVFGGADDSGLLSNLVYQLTLGGVPAWSPVNLGGAVPPARYAHSAVYDAEDHRMVIFGGRDEAGVRDDAWSLHLVGAPAWSFLDPGPTGIAPRQWHAAAWDPARDRMVVSGGRDAASPLGDVHALELGGPPAWTRLDDATGAPAPRHSHVAVVDTRRDRMLVFGGTGDAGPVAAEVWAIPLVGSRRWERLEPGGVSPGSRSGAAAIYDPARDRMLVFGGDASDGLSDETWALELASGAPQWQELATVAPRPAARAFHVAVYDPVGDRMIVSGGLNSSSVQWDTWALPLGGTPAWELVTATGGGRYMHAAAFDEARNRMIVFGGGDPPGASNSASVLTMEPSPAWQPLVASGTPPTPRAGASAVFDAGRDRMVVYGGGTELAPGGEDDAYALQFGPGGPAWTLLSPPGAWPSGRWLGSAALDPLGDRMIVFGGASGVQPLGDAWELRWRDVVGVEPPRPTVSAAAVELSPPWPNPARADVRIELALRRACRARLAVHDLSGREVRVLADGRFEAGRRVLAWDRRDARGRAVAGGIYFASLVADGARLTRKLVVMP